jgi:hypothetical protein
MFWTPKKGLNPSNVLVPFIQGFSPFLGSGRSDTRIEAPRHKRCWVRDYFPKNPRTGFFRWRMFLWTSTARPCRSSGCDPPPSCVATSLAPKGDIKLKGLSTASERRALALLPNRPLPTQHPRPTADPSVPFFAKTNSPHIVPVRTGEFL